MSDAHQRFQLKACRTFALEQNQRLFHQAWQLDHQAFALLDLPQLDAETFTQYQRLRQTARHKYREAIEHLVLINREWVDPLALQPERTPRHADQDEMQVAAVSTAAL